MCWCCFWRRVTARLSSLWFRSMFSSVPLISLMSAWKSSILALRSFVKSSFKFFSTCAFEVEGLFSRSGVGVGGY